MALCLAAPASAQNTAPPIGLALDWSLEAGWPASDVESVKLTRLGVEMPVTISAGRWRVELPVTVYPLVLARGNVRSRWESVHATRSTTYGMAAHVLAVRISRVTGAAAVYLGASGGAARFQDRVPTSRGTRWNASVDVEAGLRWVVAGDRELVLGYQFNHVSNGRTPLHNPGLDSHMVRIGVQRRIGAQRR